MLILFSGYDRSGKDSAYAAIKEEYPCQKISQAQHLKEIGNKVFGTEENMKGTGAEDYYRLVLTKTSEVIKYVTSETYFSEYLVNKIGLKKLCSREIFICTDGRYVTELTYFHNALGKYCIAQGKKHCFFPIQITRPDTPPTPYALKNHDFPEFNNFYKKVVNKDLHSFKKEIKAIASGIINSQ